MYALAPTIEKENGNSHNIAVCYRVWAWIQRVRGTGILKFTVREQYMKLYNVSPTNTIVVYGTKEYLRSRYFILIVLNNFCSETWGIFERYTFILRINGNVYLYQQSIYSYKVK